ncbi:MAG: tyrosine-type recombinase/integrase [Phocaeicola sp.]
MATIKAFIRTTKQDKETSIRFRLTDGRAVQLFYISELSILPSMWDSAKEQYKARSLVRNDDRTKLNTAINDIKATLLSAYESDKPTTSSEFVIAIDKRLHPEKYSKKDFSFFEYFDLYLEKNDKAETSFRNYMVLKRTLGRFERFKQLTDNNKFSLDIDTITSDNIEDFRDYFKNEAALQKEYPTIFESIVKDNPATIDKRKKGKLLERGNNSTVIIMKKFKAFFSWMNKQDITNNRPFDKVVVGSEVYGTPLYISLEERNKIADFDLSGTPNLEAQRDIFVFQCLIGCRVSDLLKLSSKNIVNGAVEYIAQKTKDEAPKVVRVPLNERAKAILKKYEGDCELLPFISAQRYNDAIKEIFTAAGINRLVSVKNSVTKEVEQIPINEIASSHMARRTFVGNLYKQVKDPSLVGSLSGHKEGSKAFARYRDIDEDMKKELVNLIE